MQDNPPADDFTTPEPWTEEELDSLQGSLSQPHEPLPPYLYAASPAADKDQWEVRVYASNNGKLAHIYEFSGPLIVELQREYGVEWGSVGSSVNEMLCTVAQGLWEQSKA